MPSNRADGRSTVLDIMVRAPGLRHVGPFVAAWAVPALAYAAHVAILIPLAVLVVAAVVLPLGATILDRLVLTTLALIIGLYPESVLGFLRPAVGQLLTAAGSRVIAGLP